MIYNFIIIVGKDSLIMSGIREIRSRNQNHKHKNSPFRLLLRQCACDGTLFIDKKTPFPNQQ